MLIRLIQLSHCDFDVNLLKDANIPEEAWIEGIQNLKVKSWVFIPDFFAMILDNVEITENIAMKMCERNPMYYTEEKLKSLISEEGKQKISDIFFEGLKNDVNWREELSPDLPISNEQWQWMVDNKYLLGEDEIANYISLRHDVPDFVRHHVLENSTSLEGWGPITAKDLIYWIKANRMKMNDYRCKESIKFYIQCDDMEAVMRECGWFIKYWKSQSAKLCKAAIECDPHNIQYIKKPSDKIALLALSLDRSVEKYLTKTEVICKYLNEEYEKPNPYPSKYYLVTFNQDLCDEGNLIKICVVEGEKMEDFLNLTTHLSFGNLYDDTELEVKDIASYQPITEEEYATLKKLGLDNISSGFFHNLD